MSLSILLIGGIAFAIVAAFVATGRAYDVAHPALLGESTAVGLADPAAETLGGHNEARISTQTEWNLTTVSALNEAEDLLDYLESQNYSQRELIIMGNSSFAVRWR
jgi:hypothetical protein